MFRRVSVMEFLRTGRLGGVAPGASKAEASACLGPPELEGGLSRRQRTATIWRWGFVELAFDPKSWTVHYIGLQLDGGPGSVEHPGGETLAVDLDGVRPRMPLGAFTDLLHSAAVEYEVRDDPINIGDKLVQLGSGPMAHVVMEDDPVRLGPGLIKILH